MKKIILTIVLMSAFISVIFAGTVQGYVTDFETGEPIYNAKVHFTTNDGQHICFDAYTDENGFYSMDILNETYNGRALKAREYRVTLIEGIDIEEGITVIDFELIPTSGAKNMLRIMNTNSIQNR
jgi:hypothetical protein